MDLHEWEILSDSSLIDLHEDINSNIKNTTVIDVNYFQKSSEQQKNSSVIPVPIKFDHEKTVQVIPEEEVTKLPIIESSQETDNNNNNNNNQDTTSKVFFKKTKENEFVDMKMDSPKSLNKGILPQIDVGSYQFVKNDDDFEVKSGEKDEKIIVVDEEKKEKKVEEEEEEKGVKIWKWAMTGVGAVISFGFAAATVSLIVLSNRQRETNNSKKQELHFQIYSHDKRFKQVVRRAKKLNEAISVMRGAPMTRAHITIGGYHETL